MCLVAWTGSKILTERFEPKIVKHGVLITKYRIRVEPDQTSNFAIKKAAKTFMSRTQINFPTTSTQ